jgi:hypothetical protein
MFDKFFKLFKLDKIRMLKIVEMFQYAIIFYFLTLFITDILNDYVFTKTEEEIKKMKKIKLLFNVLFHLFILVIILFYIRKIALIIPSISTYIYPGFKPHTTIEYIIHVITVFLFLETLKSLHYKVERLRDNIDIIKII